MKKRLLSTLLVISMLFSALTVMADTEATASGAVTATASDAQPETETSEVIPAPFPDVPSDNANVKAIAYAKDSGLMVGYTDGNFLPWRNVTRAEFIKILIEKDGGVANIPDNVLTGFYDVDTSPRHWAYKYIYAGVQKGYLLGMGDGSFAPENTITYEQAMKIFVCYTGREIAAQAKVSPFIPLWPTAYVLTGEQLGLSSGVNLSVGSPVDRSFTAQFFYNLNEVFKPGNNVVPIVPSGGGGDFSGGGGDDNTEYQRAYGVVVAVPGICIDTDCDSILEDLPYIYIKTTDTEGNTSYLKLRAPSSGSTNPYKKYLGYNVTAKYFENGKYDALHNPILEIAQDGLKADENKVITLADKDIVRSETTEDCIVYKAENKKKEIELPANLDDLAVVYNGVPLNQDHKPADYTSGDPYVTLADLIPERGTMTYINRDSGPIEVAIIESYDIIMNKNGYSSAGEIIDKHSNKRYVADQDKLVTYLNTLYAGSRTFTGNDVKVEIYNKKNPDSLIAYSSLNRDDILTVYSSKDKTHLKVIVSRDILGNSGGVKVTGGYASDNTVRLAGVEYEMSYYLQVVADYENIINFTEFFPQGEKITAHLDSFGKIAYVKVNEPTYIYGYLYDIDYEQGSSADRSWFNMYIITKTNINNTDQQTHVFTPLSGKLRIGGTSYNYSLYDELEALIKANATAINEGKSSTITKNATYAQPVRIELADGDTSKIKSMVLIPPAEKFTTVSSKGGASRKLVFPSGTSYTIPSTATIFSVPDDRADFESYSIATTITQHKIYNAELYKETTSTGSVLNNCVVLYDEGLNAMPTVSSSLCVVKNITEIRNDDFDTECLIETYTPTSSTSGALVNYVIKGTIDTLVAVNTSERVEVGDVITFGKESNYKETTVDGVKAYRYIKNIHHVLDISDRENYGFNQGRNESGDVTNSNSSYYWYRFGQITQIDKVNNIVVMDADQEQPIEFTDFGSFIKNAKPIFAYDDVDKDELGVAQYSHIKTTNEPPLNEPANFTFTDGAREGDLMFLFTKTTSKTVYLAYVIPNVVIDKYYPADASSATYSDITFNVTPADATVTLDGISRQAEGGTVTFENIQSGIHYYSVSAEGYKSESDIRIRVRKDEPTISYTVNLDRDVVDVRFKVKPGNATVTLGSQSKTGNGGANDRKNIVFSGIEVGQTLTYTITASGYYEQSGSIVTSTNMDDIEITLSVIKSDITFTVPEGASVEFNNTTLVADSSGQVVFERVTYGEHSYTVTHPDYLDATGSVIVGEDDQTVPVSMTRVYTLTVNVTGDGSFPIEVFTVNLGNGNISLEGTSGNITGLQAGDYSYIIYAEGYENAVGNITISDDDQLNITLALISE
ncbi:MAG: S-layer homology domain-containing protein [Clostridia bacterium]|nr:S-layer homology domain-containing protein [Clostridia bacterium]